MRRDDVLAILKAHLPDLRQRFAVRSLSLFGSVARGDDSPGSDVDVLVEFEGGVTLDKYCRLKDHLESILGPTDLITVGALRPRFAAEIARDGVRVA